MKNKKNKPCCETCANMIPIGEGDHICEEDPLVIVVSDYAPADGYLWCGGRLYQSS